MRKRSLSLLLALAMCLALLPATAFAADKVEIKWLPKGMEIQTCTPKGDRILAKNGSAWYLLDLEGNIVQPLGKKEYDSVFEFRDGMALVQAGSWPNAKFGYIDESCELVVPIGLYEDAHIFSDGLAAVKKDGMWGFIDKTGSMVIQPVYEEVGRFAEGLAPVRMGDYNTGLSGYIDKSGKIVFSYSNSSAEAGEFGYMIREFHDGLVEVTGSSEDAMTRYVDKDGKTAFELKGGEYPIWQSFYNGVVAVYSDAGNGLMDKTGAYVVAPSEGYIFTYSGPLVYVYTEERHGIVQLKAPIDPTEIFTDMEPNAYYLDPVAWAVDSGITNGKTATTFAPKENCTHGQILTFLWRAAGEPESNVEPPFEMKGNEYYYKAAKWACEKGMIGADFDHNTPCTRADAVNYIWQAAGKGAASYDGRFTDIPANSPYATAVAWAVENGVTNGATATTFNPGKICNRGEIVTFLYRYFGK